VLVDFDGDGQVVDWEKAEQDRWSKDENLSLLLAAAIANSPLSSPGIVDISGYLASLPLPSSETADGGAGVLVTADGGILRSAGGGIEVDPSASRSPSSRQS
jgi:hypothetical protein